MSSMFSSPKTPKPPPIPEQIESVTESGKDADSVRRKTVQSMMKSGRASTVLAGISTALKKRLGE